MKKLFPKFAVRRKTFCGLFVLALFQIPVVVSAEELRIVDSLGLVRFAQEVDAARTVVISTTNLPPKEIPSLTSVQGFGSDIAGEKVAENQFRFPAVAPGTWQVHFSIPGGQVSSVKVLKTQ